MIYQLMRAKGNTVKVQVLDLSVLEGSLVGFDRRIVNRINPYGPGGIVIFLPDKSRPFVELFDCSIRPDRLMGSSSLFGCRCTIEEAMSVESNVRHCPPPPPTRVYGANPSQAKSRLTRRTNRANSPLAIVGRSNAGT
jgi:hypothetical protein